MSFSVNGLLLLFNLLLVTLFLGAVYFQTTINIYFSFFIYDRENLTFPMRSNKPPAEHLISSTNIVCSLDIKDFDGLIYFDDSIRRTKGFENLTLGYQNVYHALLNYDVHFYVFWNMFVSWDTSIAYDNCRYTNFPWGGGLFHNGPLIDHVDEIIVTGSRFGQQGYGHMMTDFLHSLFLMPEEIQTRSKILIPRNNDGKTYLIRLGYKVSQFVILPPNSWIHASFVYSVFDHAPASYLFGNLTGYFHKRIDKAFHLSNIVPSKYYYCNRQYLARRYIHNMKEIMDLAQKNHPEIKFENLTDILPTVEETSLKWASAKFIFLPSGANTFKSIFMRPHTVLVMASTVRGDFTPLKFAVTNSLFIVQFATNLHHVLPPGCPIDVNQSMLNIDRGLYCCEHKRWPRPSDTDFKPHYF